MAANCILANSKNSLRSISLDGKSSLLAPRPSFVAHRRTLFGLLVAVFPRNQDGILRIAPRSFGLARVTPLTRREQCISWKVLEFHFLLSLTSYLVHHIHKNPWRFRAKLHILVFFGHRGFFLSQESIFVVGC